MRLIVVSNRLPFTLSRRDGRVRFRPSSGGLASGLGDCLEGLLNGSNISGSPQEAAVRTAPAIDDYVWVGWPGAFVEPHLEPAVVEAAKARRAVPVFLSPADEDLFYTGFSNRTVWPIFHSFGANAHIEPRSWEAYRRVNGAFAEVVARIAQPGDLIWVHDYQLMLLPELLRRALPSARIGYFHHIPFPPFELLQLLPSMWAREIVSGILGADLVGFHTLDYSRHFFSAVWRLLGVPHRCGAIERPAHTASVGVFPMSIDGEKYARAAHSPFTETERRRFDDLFPQQKVIVSIDRLDYTKGILHRLEAFAAFLERCPEWQRRVSLALVVVPSRVGVADYRAMKRAIDQLVGDINGRFSAVGWAPIFYRYRNLTLPELSALYARSDAALVTPLRDGMNLIAKEYVASHPEGRGVLILSAFAGAADELGDALIVNPADSAEMVEAIREALEMSPDEQAARLGRMNARIAAYSVYAWAADFLAALQSPRRPPLLRGLAQVGRTIVSAYRAAEKRLLFLDYDGTLMPFQVRPEAVEPDRELLILLERLARDRRNTVVLVSGRDRWTLTKWFGAMPLHIIAEHGAWIKTAAGEWEHAAWADESWKGGIKPILSALTGTVPGSFVEEKPTSLVWHYRGAASSHAEQRARDVVEFLLTFTAHVRVRVVPAQKAVEVQVGGVDKGLAAGRFVGPTSPDFVMALGDDFTDEDIVSVLPTDAFTVHVGDTPTSARFAVRDHTEARFLLSDCTAPVLDGAEAPEPLALSAHAP